MDLEELYDRLYRYCYFRLADKQSAQDVTQETFLRFYRQGLSFDKGGELPYLYVIARNLCSDEFRKKAIKNISEQDLEEKTGEDDSKSWEDRLAVRAAMDRLTAQERDLLILRYVSEYSINLISGAMGISRFAVHRRLAKALKNLKDELEKEGFK